MNADERAALKEAIDRRAREKLRRETKRDSIGRTIPQWKPRPRSSPSPTAEYERNKARAKRKKELEARGFEVVGEGHDIHITCPLCGKTTKANVGKASRHNAGCGRFP